MKKKLKTILLIDDDTPTNYYHQIILQDANCTENVVIQYSSDRALDYFRTLKNNNQPFPELVFLDMNMPGWDGFQFIEMLQTFFPSTKDKIKIVILTSLPEAPSLQKIELDNQIVGVKSKPLTEKVVLELIQTHFSTNSSLMVF
ncbi:MAG: response regulator [Saprospiraceae bacterium]|jgi:CheY-like chemotaxis protein|nr:response regulator [Saprospiraceae bacterium]